MLQAIPILKIAYQGCRMSWGSSPLIGSGVSLVLKQHRQLKHLDDYTASNVCGPLNSMNHLHLFLRYHCEI